MDDGFDPKKSPEVFKKLIEEKNVFAMFLSRGTPTTEAGYSVLEKNKVPLIGPSTGAMSMYNLRRGNSLSRCAPATTRKPSRSCRRSLVNMGITKIALLIYVDDSPPSARTGSRACSRP